LLEAARAGMGETVLSRERPVSARPARLEVVPRRALRPGSRSSVGRSIDLVGTDLPYLPFCGRRSAL